MTVPYVELSFVSTVSRIRLRRGLASSEGLSKSTALFVLNGTVDFFVCLLVLGGEGSNPRHVRQLREKEDR